MNRSLFGLWLFGVVSSFAASAAAQNYRLPLGRDGVSCAGGNCIPTAYRDHGGGTDWHCGGNTYAGHTGTDLAPVHAFGDCVQTFPIVAAAAGSVIAVHDGEQDHCDCDAVGCATGYGNYVMLQHADGKVTMYGHMAQGTVAVSTGQFVECGAFLGRVGQTGNTTGPHLHFEVREGGVVRDPFDGTCSGPPSYWVDQGAYLGLPGDACEAAAPPPGPACGNASCEPGEDCNGCAADCGACPPACGDGICDFGESCDACAADCGACAAPACGDGTCSFGEACDSCPQDCGACAAYCGDNACNGGEDCVVCATDCGACPAYCGDGACNAGESCASCPNDCGGCPTWCGDGLCNAGESCATCANDCGTCGCSVNGQLGVAENGDACWEAPETWRCAFIASLGAWGSQVCRQGIWQTFNLNPLDCAGCCGGYSSACSAL